MLRIEFADIFVKAGLVRHMRTRELEHLFAAKCVREIFLAYTTLASDKSSVAPCPAALDVHDPSHSPTRMGWQLGIERRVRSLRVRRERLRSVAGAERVTTARVGTKS